MTNESSCDTLPPQREGGNFFMVKNSFVHYLTKVLVDIMFYGGIVICLSLPVLVPRLLLFFGYRYPDEVELLFTVILGAAGICTIYILYQLKQMFKTLLGGDPFVSKNVSCFRKCGVASFLIALIFIIRLLFGFTIGSSVVVIIFGLLGLFCLTLKDLFKQAVAYKEENDWTV